MYFKIIYKNYSPFKAGEFLLFFNFKNTKKCIQIPYNIRRYKTKNMTQLHFVCMWVFFFLYTSLLHWALGPTTYWFSVASLALVGLSSFIRNYLKPTVSYAHPIKYSLHRGYFYGYVLVLEKY